MPAAAVIPAPIVYIRVVAVKKLVVGFLSWSSGSARMGLGLHALGFLPVGLRASLRVGLFLGLLL